MNRRSIKNFVYFLINDRPWAGQGLLFLARAIPRSGRSLRWRNVLEAYGESVLRREEVVSRPLIVRLATIAVCNYKCLFCEVHKDDLLFPKRNPNRMTPEDFLNYDGVLSAAWKLDLYGGSAEPLVNKDVRSLTEYLKTRYGTELFLNTNASLLDRDMADAFVKWGFDSILVSYHAGTSEGYRRLMTGDVRKVDENLGYLRDKKRARRTAKPAVFFNFALQKLNAPEGTVILDKAKTMGAAGVYINRYYGGRNKLQDDQVSFENDPEEGNKALREIYDHAGKIGMRVFPEKPCFWGVDKEKKDHQKSWDPEKWDRERTCHFPWIQVHFEPVLDAADSHYVCVCNRIMLFKIDYSKFSMKTEADFKRLWNHPVIQYLRSTVNCKTKCNPICRFCKHPDLPRLRNVDSEKYAALRDQAVEEFFRKARAFCGQVPDIEGVEVLQDNPVSDRKFKDQLRVMESEQEMTA
jgi:wyosine [tRNA(Phe)-imidazoG37] synthetase (radical SAM superfamily)